MLTFDWSVVMVMVAMAMGDTCQRMFESNLEDDVIFAQNLLFEAQAISTGACSVWCAKTDNCSTFTFTTMSGVCRGHALNVTSSSSVTSVWMNEWMLIKRMKTSTPGTFRYVIGVGDCTIQSPTPITYLKGVGFCERYNRGTLWPRNVITEEMNQK